MRAGTNFRRIVTTSLVAGALVVGGVAAASASGAASKPKGVSGTISFAEGPGANPNYIFPYMGCSYFSVDNINQFQELMYRPLYWFGLGASTAVQYPLSLAAAPAFSGGNKTVTINLKGWKFSNGQTVDGQSVQFFLNLYKADPGSYCGYNAGYGIPDDLTSATNSGNTVTLHFSKSVNANWLLYNYLSEITPFPQAWDITSAGAAAGSGGCATAAYGSSDATTKCKAVEAYLDGIATNTSTYTSAPWNVVDGPWKLSAFDTLGNATFVPNNAYSGPQHAQVAQFEEKAYTSETAEESDLYAGNLTEGTVDPNQLPSAAPAPGKVGGQIAALKGKYNLVSGSPWSFNYSPFNFATGKKGDPQAAVLKQLYIRQALQLTVNQLAIIKSVDKGYGWPTYSPLPPNTPSSISGKVTNPYPYSETKAASLLKAHGWSKVGSVQTCEKPGTAAGDCGAGIAKGAKLNFSIIWASGSPALDSTFEAQISSWDTLGIHFTHTTKSFNDVISQCNGGSFQICSWGAGWIYAPDYYPSGETLFQTSGSFDVGDYSDPQMTKLILATTQGTAPLTQYAQYAADQLPVLYEPNPTGTGEVSVKVKGTQPPNPLANWMPEYLHF